MAYKFHRSLEEGMMVELGLVFLGKNDMQLVSHSSQMLAGRAFTVRPVFTCNTCSGEDEQLMEKCHVAKTERFQAQMGGY